MSLERAVRRAYSGGAGDFGPPPEAPVFEPTLEEFGDPLAYIARIRPAAEPFGICKIRPPARWRPPFSLDVDRLRFSPRIQKLNELQGISRLRLHFEDRLCRFWEHRGDPLKDIPAHEDRPVNLFSLYHGVRLEGGYEECAAGRKWGSVAEFVGYRVTPASEEFVENTYARVLLPFHRVCSAPAPPKKEPPKDESPDDDVTIVSIETVDAVPLPTVEEAIRGGRLTKTKTGSDIKSVEKCSRELRRLACYGAGPKMPVCEEDPDSEEPHKPRKRLKLERDPLAIHGCSVCKDETEDADLIFCNGCSESCHLSCANPPLDRRPTGPWLCPPCLTVEMKKPIEPYGFAQSERTYSLQEFGERADKFKSDHFGVPSHLVPPSKVEREFWRLVSSTEEDVTVLYGADLHSMDHGSGFPTSSSVNLYAADQEYVDSGWNLNNLPVLDGSVLNFINGAISGMTVPWMYVGMCFSSFCWHNEDHWSYSINYLHWGESKTWYGVPGSSAELLEKRMQSIIPELFQSQPDLLHQLVTILNPNVLSEAGVPIYRMDQNVGEFIVTFPRSYHAGFNQGYNFAEAVNFAPPDWLSVGRECVLHYKSIKRLCVFSHDELICKIGLSAKRLDLSIAISTYKELINMVRNETEQRGSLAKHGVREASLRQFELLDDDQRLCEVCKTTCFLSALACKKCKVMVCLDHASDVCDCPPVNLHLFYRYKLDELHLMIQTLKERIQIYDKWMSEVKSVLQPTSPSKTQPSNLTRLLDEASLLNIPKCKILDRLAIECKKLSNVDPEVIEIID